MHTITREITINAPKQKVWDLMLSDETYKEWTEPFQEGSRAITDWKEGSKVQFVDGTMSGMLAVIKEKKPYDTITFEMKGLMNAGQEDTESDWAKTYNGLLETYTFKEENGITHLHIIAGAEESMAEEMEASWDKALAKLKEMAESN